MKSLYAKYIQEREGKEIIESDNGFATYKIYNNGECYLQDIYVVPEHRKTNLATEMANKVVSIAKENGCTKLVGSVSLDGDNPTRNMKIFLNYGMSLHSIQGNMIFLVKNIQEQSNG